MDEAGVRDQMEVLLRELITEYVQRDEVTRSAIRRLFSEYKSFAWAATLPTPRTSREGLRQHLILFSMQDQCRDSRDALLALQEICREAVAAGVETDVALRQVAAMSSSANRYGVGSTRDMF